LPAELVHAREPLLRRKSRVALRAQGADSLGLADRFLVGVFGVLFHALHGKEGA
jgi:hypothetical protein